MNLLASLEAAVAALVALWLAAGLLANPLLLGAVALLALVPLGLVVLPALGVHALGERSVSVRLLPPVRSAVEPGPADPRGAVASDD
jgi:fatty acid desaturase